MDVLTAEGRRRQIEVATKHGAYVGGKELPEHAVWRTMLARCNNPRQKDYANYGGRGIKVCNRWALYENFIDDMGRRPSAAHQLDRIDNDGGYSLDNCRWTTRSIQQKNRRSNVRYECNGQVKTLSEWAEATGLSIQLARWRIKNKGGLLTPEIIVVPL